LGRWVVERLRGMFAFALFEATPYPRLLLGRDRFGIKPLYTSDDRSRVVFASEVSAVLRSGLVPSVTDPEALRRFLELGNVPAPLTTMKDIRPLPVAHVAQLDASGSPLDALLESGRGGGGGSRVLCTNPGRRGCLHARAPRGVGSPVTWSVMCPLAPSSPGESTPRPLSPWPLESSSSR
jgi:hypothetical protein